MGRQGARENEKSALRPPHSALFSWLQRGGLFMALFVTPLIYATLLVTQSDPTAFLRASLAALAMLIATLLWLATWAVVAARNRGWLQASSAGLMLVALLFIDFTSSTGALSHLRTVLRDKLVSRTISRTDFFSRKYIRRTLPIMAMVITPSPLLRKEAG